MILKNNQNTDKIDVSVVMLTYFCKDYVAKAIDTILEQETDYTFEIVIADDYSTDGTREVLKQYEKEYPDIIKVIYNDKNLGITNNSFNARCNCRGRYITWATGDDYWIDKDKIQWQVDFLDSHSEFFAVGAVLEARFDDEETAYAVYPGKKYQNTTITLDMYLKGAMFSTGGLMMPNEFLTEEGRKFFSIVPQASSYIDDATECILILSKGPVFISEKRSTVHRVHRITTDKKNYNSRYSTRQKIRQHFELYNNLNRILEGKYDLFHFYKENVAWCEANAIKTIDFSDFKELYNTVPIDYRKRALLFRSTIRCFGFAMEAFARKVKSKIG